MIDGVYLVDKPQGLSSHDVVGCVRRLLGRSDVGHAGTLDPMATGLMVVLVGEATKLSAYLAADDKVYAARVILGSSTASLDADSPRDELSALSAALLTEFAEPFCAHTAPLLVEALQQESARESQVPPVISAIHIDGVRAYKRALKGELPEMPPREVQVRAVTYAGHGIDEQGDAWLDVELHVGKGYYVRSFARDMAERVGTLGHLSSLRRLQSGVFRIEQACTLQDTDTLRNTYISVTEAALRCMPHWPLSEEDARLVRNGIKLAIVAPLTSSHVAAIDPTGELVAVLGPNSDSTKLRILRGFTLERSAP